MDRNRVVQIEMRHACVALLAEGVDRNIGSKNIELWKGKSPSSRRAWIEIGIAALLPLVSCVALLAEGVDRNNDLSNLNSGAGGGRPPRGGRG